MTRPGHREEVGPILRYITVTWILPKEERAYSVSLYLYLYIIAFIVVGIVISIIAVVIINIVIVVIIYSLTGTV